MALRKEEFDWDNERARSMSNDQSIQRNNVEISRKLYHRIEIEAATRQLAMSEYLEQLLDETVPKIDGVTLPGCPPYTRKY